MQSNEEECLLHSCFSSLKTAVMGCCYSFCNKENDPQEHIVNERTHLLEVAEQQQETPVPTSSTSTPPRKPDEQSALNRILHETATNVIDVGALGPYALEPGAYSERVRAYTARVAAAPLGGPGPGAGPGQGPGPGPGPLVRALSPGHRLLADVPPPERSGLLARPPLTHDDKELITNAVKKAAAALSELRVEHHEDLVVPFRVP
ncbi:ragulator complex protein LAMTOR1 [Achroia grisella]|uniref:ragulator complex protein LAMTOR1 n=1 Tax=Achroia grisella TaxID=688607 RepID=UPI0027D2C6F7|nr:ragulator complex protein LAMTOR1 [Achroia grisella]